jgi:hypothetical protein
VRSFHFPLALTSALLLVYALDSSPARGQYMFLDANGDGRNDQNDSLRSDEWAEVIVWLDTVRNRDGSLGTNGSTSTLAGYELTIECPGRSWVEWGRFTPEDPAMSVVQGPMKDSLAFNVRVRCDRIGRAGMQKLGRLKMRVHHEGELRIVPCRAMGEMAWTSFSTQPGGPELRLGPTVAASGPPRAVPGEWSDAGGLDIRTEDPFDSKLFRVDRGVFYLDWNRMRRPYEIRFIGGRLAVNGMALPKPARRYPRHQLPEEWRAASDLYRSVSSVSTVLHARGVTDSVVLSEMIRAAHFSSIVDSVSVAPSGYPLGFTMYMRGVSAYSFQLLSWGPWRIPNRRDEVNRYLEALVRELRQGRMVQVSTRGGPGRMRWDEQMDRAIVGLQAGRALSHADSMWLRTIESNVSRWDEIAHPLPLERVP